MTKYYVCDFALIQMITKYPPKFESKPITYEIGALFVGVACVVCYIILLGTIFR